MLVLFVAFLAVMVFVFVILLLVGLIQTGIETAILNFLELTDEELSGDDDELV